MSCKGTARKGRLGEDTACDILRNKGYTLIARNYHSAYGEIDIIAVKDDVIVFAEVKARRKNSMEAPANAVTPSKQRKIIKTAEKYLEEKNPDLFPRFDVIEIFLDEEGMNVLEYNHIKNAFWKS